MAYTLQDMVRDIADDRHWCIRPDGSPRLDEEIAERRRIRGDGDVIVVEENPETRP